MVPQATSFIYLKKKKESRNWGLLLGAGKWATSSLLFRVSLSINWCEKTRITMRKFVAEKSRFLTNTKKNTAIFLTQSLSSPHPISSTSSSIHHHQSPLIRFFTSIHSPLSSSDSMPSSSNSSPSVTLDTINPKVLSLLSYYVCFRCFLHFDPLFHWLSILFTCRVSLLLLNFGFLPPPFFILFYFIYYFFSSSSF